MSASGLKGIANVWRYLNGNGVMSLSFEADALVVPFIQR